MENIPEKKERKGRGNRGRDTIFRVASRNQIELIAIADNKSNMLVGICVVLISLVIAVLGSGISLQGQRIITRPDLLIPMFIILFFALISAICAIMAAKPQIIKSSPGAANSLLFFQSIYEKSQEEYLRDMHQLLGNKQSTYDQLIIDMYHNGVVLHRKYKLLGTAYLLFMIGLVISVLSFIIATAIIHL